MLQRSYNDEFLVSAWVTYHLFEIKGIPAGVPLCYYSFSFTDEISLYM